MYLPPNPQKLNNNSGVSAIELLLVIAMIAVIAGFAVASLYRGDRAAFRTNTAVEIAAQLQKARADSIRRNARDLKLMAQVKIFNHRLYSIAMDSDGDGNLDIPLIKSLPEQTGIEMSGPFPKNYIFNWQGQTVDSQNNRVEPEPLTVGGKSGASAIKFLNDGKIVVIPAIKLTASR